MSTAVHHLNCATMRPALALGGRLTPPRMVAHCLLVETASRLVLVDTGFGTDDLAAPRERLGRGFVSMMRPALDADETALAQVRALGHDPAAVTDVVLTHLDLDHAGGLADFPHARVHVFAEELAAARMPATLKERNRYVPDQWAHRPHWQEHPVAGDRWLGFEAARALDDDVVLVPLRGHTRGHCGVAVRRPDGDWFLHAGDSYFDTEEKRTPPSCARGLRVFQTLMQQDRTARLANQERLRALHRDHGPGSGADETVTMFSAHDAGELDALTGSTR